MSIENKIFCHQQQNLRHENILNREYQKLSSAKNILEIFAMFNFTIVLLAAQVNRKIESDVDFSGRRGQVSLRVY